MSGSNPDYPSMMEAEDDGCFHPRCIHTIYTYYPEIDQGNLKTERGPDVEESPEYTARSQQRYMERQVRRYKSRMAAAVTPQSERQAYNLVRRWQGKLRQHIADNADKVLPRQYWREGGRQTLRFTKATGARLADGTRTKPTKGWQKSHAERYYAEVAARKPFQDAKAIAKHTGFTEQQVEDIRQHMFVKKHDFGDGEHHRFFPSYQQSLAWQRLRDGNGTEDDKLLLQHEYEELTLMRDMGYNQRDAHDIADQSYPWWATVKPKVGEDYVGELPED